MELFVIFAFCSCFRAALSFDKRDGLIYDLNSRTVAGEKEAREGGNLIRKCCGPREEMLNFTCRETDSDLFMKKLPSYLRGRASDVFAIIGSSCEISKYRMLLDPESEPSDNFSIGGNGQLLWLSEELEFDRSSYCIDIFQDSMSSFICIVDSEPTLFSIGISTPDYHRRSKRVPLFFQVC